MKFKVYFGSHCASIETERPIACALVGQRDEGAAKPVAALQRRAALSEAEVKNEEMLLTKDEQQAIADFSKARTKGQFDTKLLDWFETEKAALDAQAAWPDRINFRIIPVSTTIP